MAKFAVTIKKGIVSGVATQATYTYEVTESKIDAFVEKVEAKGYEVWDVHLINKASTFDTGEDEAS